jgi:hypothetical protein
MWKERIGDCQTEHTWTLAIWSLERNFYDPIPSVSFQLKDTTKKKNIPVKPCNRSNTYRQQKESAYTMLETVDKRKLDFIKWMDTTKTRTDNNTSWNLTECSGTDVYTVTMTAPSTRSMVWPWVIYTNEPWRRNDTWKIKGISTLESGNACSTEKFEKTTLYETLSNNPRWSTRWNSDTLCMEDAPKRLHCLKKTRIYHTSM